MPNIHIYGEKDRKCLRDEDEVRVLMAALANNDGNYRRIEGSVNSGHASILTYSGTKKKLICVMRATRITDGKWWLVWDIDRIDISKFNFNSEVKS